MESVNDEDHKVLVQDEEIKDIQKDYYDSCFNGGFTNDLGVLTIQCWNII